MYREWVRPLLFRFDPERVHHWVYQLAVGLSRIPPLQWSCQKLTRIQDPVVLMGIKFPNRVGLAAGFDKQGHFPKAAAAMGFGHIEVGAVTPLAQPGQARPRLHRAPPCALRNHMGFNNDGVEKVVARLRGRQPLVIGLNLGKGIDTPLEQALDDYVAVLQASASVVDYFSINISSPNTSGLRQLAEEAPLRSLCQGLRQAADEEAQRRGARPRPLLIKVSPDQQDRELKTLARVAEETGMSGLIATNTTVQRPAPWDNQPPQGGLSGLPLLRRSPEVVALLRQELGPDFTIIGVGGVYDEATALNMRRAGADLVQVYTGLIYEGPGLPRRLAAALAKEKS